jgi:hypothetical protein
MPNNLINNSRIRRENQRLFINSAVNPALINEIHGLQSISANWENQIVPLKHIGASQRTQVIWDGPGVANYSALSFLVQNDKFIEHTGLGAFNSYIIKDKANTTNNYGFISGYLTSYRSRCSIGEIPQIEVGVVAYGNAGLITSEDSPEAYSCDFPQISTYNSDFDLNIAGPGTMSINWDGSNSTRLQSYDLSITINRQPIYVLGQRMPISVQINYPLELNLSLSFEPDGYLPHKMFDFPCDPTVQSFQLQLGHYITGGAITTYSFSDLFLVGEPMEINVDGNLSMIANYRSYLSRE